MEDTIEKEIELLQKSVINWNKENSTVENKFDMEKALVFGYYIDKETVPKIIYQCHLNCKSILTIPVR